MNEAKRRPSPHKAYARAVGTIEAVLDSRLQDADTRAVDDIQDLPREGSQRKRSCMAREPDYLHVSMHPRASG